MMSSEKVDVNDIHLQNEVCDKPSTAINDNLYGIESTTGSSSGSVQGEPEDSE